MDWKLVVQRPSLFVGAVGIFVAYNSQPVLEAGSTELIITEGIPAPTPALWTPGVRPLSDLAASASLGAPSTCLQHLRRPQHPASVDLTRRHHR